jgi:HK97 family phage portal protein
MGLAPEEAQFLQTRSFQLSDISRALRIPKHKLQDLSDAHYDNLESQEQTYINDSLRPFCDRFEAECRNKLLMPSDRKLGLQVRFDFDSMVRGTTKDRYANYAVGKQNGWLSTDDIRRAEGMTDLPDGAGAVYRESLATAPATGSQDQPNKVPPTGTPARQETTH